MTNQERKKLLAEIKAQLEQEIADTKARVTPADCDRWDTIPGILTVTSKPDPERQKWIDDFNIQRAIEAAEKAKGKK